jgi:hypothetical protein
MGARALTRFRCFASGHSMGALAQCLIASRYAVTRAGNVLISAHCLAHARAALAYIQLTLLLQLRL